MSTARSLTVCLCGVISLLAGAGCGSSYKQPLASDCATIRMDSPNAYISRVDERSTTDAVSRTVQGVDMFIGGGTLPIGKAQVSVLPGKHTIEVQAFALATDLWLVAEPEGQYVVKFGKGTKQGVPVWIEDARTSKPVGGIKGSADEPPDEAPSAAESSPKAPGKAP